MSIDCHVIIIYYHIIIFLSYKQAKYTQKMTIYLQPSSPHPQNVISIHNKASLSLCKRAIYSLQNPFLILRFCAIFLCISSHVSCNSKQPRVICCRATLLLTCLSILYLFVVYTLIKFNPGCWHPFNSISSYIH